MPGQSECSHLCCSHVGFCGCSGLRFLFSPSIEAPGPGVRAEPDPGASPGSSRKPEASCGRRGAVLASQREGAFAARWSSSHSGGPNADMAEMCRWCCLRWAGGRAPMEGACPAGGQEQVPSSTTEQASSAPPTMERVDSSSSSWAALAAARGAMPGGGRKGAAPGGGSRTEALGGGRPGLPLCRRGRSAQGPCRAQGTP